MARTTTSSRVKANIGERLIFADIERITRSLATHIEKNKEELINILLSYESYEVATDEIARTLDHLRSLKENQAYFKVRVGPVAAFLPRNQPLYALTCFVIVPSLMATEAHFRIPQSMRDFFPKLLTFLKLKDHFPNIYVSHKQRVEFLEERSAVKVDPRTGKTVPITDVVIFTGTPTHANQLRVIFDPRTLFIANGAGHNPVVVSRDADLTVATDAVITLQLYNQGQDCAAPNAILVHKAIAQEFMELLRQKIQTTKVGLYRDRECRVGPISDPKDLVRIEEFLIDHREWLDPTTPGVLRARDAIVEPTIVRKPLKEGGNYSEIFAPIIVVQEYNKDSDLSEYFENVRYAQNAMYITLFGSSGYIEGLVERKFDGRVLHDKASIIRNTHLHAPGIERGTQQYGGYGYGASSISIHGKIIAKPTLPQREIFEYLEKPLLKTRVAKERKRMLTSYTDTDTKDVQKLLRLTTNRGDNETLPSPARIYVDLKATPSRQRYVSVAPEHSYALLDRPNVEFIARLTSSDVKHIRTLRSLLQKKDLTPERFQSALYEIVKKPGAREEDNRARQQRFFGQVYQLLLGRNSGPRLAQFLLDIDRTEVVKLLDL